MSNLLSRLYGLAAHPSSMHRLGFAFALNSADVYRQLRNDQQTLDVHLFELVRQTFLALRLAQTDPPALGSVEMLSSVVGHLQRMLLGKHIFPLLLKPNAKRTACREGIGAFAEWLFRQCAQSKAQARMQASVLFEALCAKMRAHAGRKTANGRGGGVGGGRWWRRRQ